MILIKSTRALYIDYTVTAFMRQLVPYGAANYIELNSQSY